MHGALLHPARCIRLALLWLALLGLSATAELPPRTAPEVSPPGIVQIAPQASETPENFRQNITPQLEYLVDEQHRWTIEQLTSPLLQRRFSPVNIRYVRHGHLDADLWLRMTLAPYQLDEQLYLQFPTAPLSEIDLYLPTDNGWEIRQAGVHRSPVSGDLPSHTFLFALPANNPDYTTLFIRVRSDITTNFTLYLLTESALQHYHMNTLLWTGILLGLVLALFAGTGFVYWKTRQSALLLFAFFLLSLTGFLLTQWGILGIYLLPIPGLQHNLQVVLTFVAIIAGLLFIYRMLEPPTATNPAWINAASLCLLLFSCIAITLPFSSTSYYVAFAAAAGVLSALLALAITVTYARSRQPHAGLLVSGIILLGLTVTVSSVLATGLVNLPFDLGWLVLFGSLLSTGLFLYVIIRRYQSFLDEQQKEKQALLITEATGKATSDFSTKVIHDLRTPLAGIMGMCELLQDSALTTQQKDYLSTIQGSGEQLLQFISRIQDYAQLESGELHLNQMACNLVSLLNDSLKYMQAKADEKSVEFISSIDPDLPPQLLLDENRLKRLIISLCQDALHRTPMQGSIVLELAALKTDPPTFRCQIRDNAKPLSPRALSDYLTPPQWHSDQTAQQMQAALLHQTLAIMGSRLQGRTHHNGNSFWFDLPLAQPTETGSADDTEQLRFDGMKLLVVDDNELVTRVISRQALGWGMRVMTASNGAEALAIIRNEANLDEPFDVIILDHDMPGMTGLQVAARIKEDALITEPVVTIMLTGLANAPSQTMARNAGIRQIITKPVSGNSLKLVIAEEVGRLREFALHEENSPPLVMPENLRVLVAEDDYLSRKVIRGMLQKLGIEAHIVENGQQALDERKADTYDLILMDCEMPEMNGFEATRAIREWEQRYQKPAIPIIALTAHILTEQQEKSFAAGMNSYLTKPLEMAELKSALARWAPSRRLH